MSSTASRSLIPTDGWSRATARRPARGSRPRTSAAARRSMPSLIAGRGTSALSRCWRPRCPARAVWPARCSRWSGAGVPRSTRSSSGRRPTRRHRLARWSIPPAWRPTPPRRSTGTTRRPMEGSSPTGCPKEATSAACSGCWRSKPAGAWATRSPRRGPRPSAGSPMPRASCTPATRKAPSTAGWSTSTGSAWRGVRTPSSGATCRRRRPGPTSRCRGTAAGCWSTSRSAGAAPTCISSTARPASGGR